MKLNLHYVIPYPNAHTIMLTALIVVVICSIMGMRFLPKEKWKYFVGTLATLYWISMIVSMTMLGRIKTEAPQMELRLFWCIKEAWTAKNAMDWYFFTGNIALFIPLGVILPCFFNFSRRWWKCLLIGFQVSLAVEILQLALHLGLFELDDLVNNTFGCLLGYSLYIICLWMRRKRNITFLDKGLAVSTWILTIGFLAVAVLSGQPVFDLLVR